MTQLKESTEDLTQDEGDFPGAHDFPKAEYVKRVQKLQSIMRDVDMAAILITSEVSHRYITGHWSHRWYNWTRPIVSILPASADPVLVVSGVEAGMAKITSWINDIRPYTVMDQSSEAVVEVIGEVLREYGAGTAKIGVDFGEFHRLGLPLTRFRELTQLLPTARFEDASELLCSLRVVKSPMEIARMRDAVRILNDVFGGLPNWFRPDMTENEVYRRFVIEVMHKAADKPGYIIVNADIKGPYPGGSLTRPIRDGSVFYIDAGCLKRGYWSDYSRYFAVGRSSTKQKDAYKLIWDLTAACLDTMRPGKTVGDIYAAYERVISKTTVPVIKTQFAGRLGHAIGLDQCEYPSITKNSPLVLEPGMTFCIEPSFRSSDTGLFFGEEQVVVTADGYEMLSDRANECLKVLNKI
jgi:Xaa-Pro aminopeptidase